MEAHFRKGAKLFCLITGDIRFSVFWRFWMCFFWFFDCRFWPREGFHRLPRPGGIDSGRIWAWTDPPRPDSLPKPLFLVLISSTNPHFGPILFYLSRQRCFFWIFWRVPRAAPSKVSMFRFRERSSGRMRGQLCSNKFQNLVQRAVFCLESRTAFIF